MDEGTEGALDPPPFPSPDELWERRFGALAVARFTTALPAPPPGALGLADWRLRFADVPFEAAGGKWEPRYYQRRAIDAATDAIAAGQRRVLLTLATGTGKTAIAFQIAWRLHEARWSLAGTPKRRPRILFLADRNILADQAVNAFTAFEDGAIVRITPERIKKNGGVPMNGAVFFSIFQTLMTDRAGLDAVDESGEGEIEAAAEPNYLGYPPDFFDLVVIDECHRGGARDESTWRRILEHFAPAAQLGLTATPKRGANVDTYAWFGEPVYEYALRTGIEDGFLTPFKVRQMASTMDEFTPEAGDVLDGEAEARTYTEAEINRVIEIPERELSRVREFMGAINPSQKALVFCASQRHAAMVRDMINQVADSTDPHYCVRVTAEDGERGEEMLRQFQDNERTIPTILTTSQKLSTGVDARNVRNIVLMRPVRSIVEFKQIVGRGTRVYPGKDHFTILDFVRAYEHFQDPEWDGPPEDVTKTGPDEPPAPPPGEPPDPEGPDPDGPDGPGLEGPKITRVALGPGRARSIRYVSTTTYWFDGRQISAPEFLERLFGDLSALFPDEDALRRDWSDPATRKALLARLEEMGYDADRLADMRRLIEAADSDIFDVLAYVRFELAPQTRADRAGRVRAEEIAAHDAEMRAFLEQVLGHYVKDGVGELDPDRLGGLIKARYGSTRDAKVRLGDMAMVKKAFVDLQHALYRA
jgi:type I restriction enzyme R subunit